MFHVEFLFILFYCKFSPPDLLANPHLRCSLSASQTVCSFFSSGFTRKPAPPVLSVCFAVHLLFLLLRIYSQTRTSGALCLLRRPFALSSPPDLLANRTSGAPCLLRRPFALSSPPVLLANTHLRCSLSASQTVCSLINARKQITPSVLLVFFLRLLHYIILRTLKYIKNI